MIVSIDIPVLHSDGREGVKAQVTHDLHLRLRNCDEVRPALALPQVESLLIEEARLAAPPLPERVCLRVGRQTFELSPGDLPDQKTIHVTVMTDAS